MDHNQKNLITNTKSISIQDKENGSCYFSSCSKLDLSRLSNSSHHIEINRCKLISSNLYFPESLVWLRLAHILTPIKQLDLPDSLRYLWLSFSTIDNFNLPPFLRTLTLLRLFCPIEELYLPSELEKVHIRYVSGIKKIYVNKKLIYLEIISSGNIELIGLEENKNLVVDNVEFKKKR